MTLSALRCPPERVCVPRQRLSPRVWRGAAAPRRHGTGTGAGRGSGPHSARPPPSSHGNCSSFRGGLSRRGTSMGLARPRPYPSPPADGGGTGAHALPCVPSGPHSPIRQWLAEPSPEHEEEPHPRHWPVLLGAAEPRLPPPSVRHGLELAGPTCSHLYLNLRVVSEADRTGGPGPALGASARPRLASHRPPSPTPRGPSQGTCGVWEVCTCLCRRKLGTNDKRSAAAAEQGRGRNGKLLPFSARISTSYVLGPHALQSWPWTLRHQMSGDSAPAQADVLLYPPARMPGLKKHS